MKKKVLAWVLSLVMLLSLIPMTFVAAEPATGMAVTVDTSALGTQELEASFTVPVVISGNTGITMVI